MRICRHKGAGVIRGCIPCYRWATRPEDYCQTERIECPSVPYLLQRRRQEGVWVVWEDPEMVERIAVLNNTPIPQWSSSLTYPRSYPGNELKTILLKLGVSPSSDCACQDRIRQMNEWGVEECVRHREEIVAWLRESQQQMSWSDWLVVVRHGLFGCWAFNPVDPIGSLVDLAIQRAREKQSC